MFRRNNGSLLLFSAFLKFTWIEIAKNCQSRDLDILVDIQIVIILYRDLSYNKIQFFAKDVFCCFQELEFL